MTRPDCEAMRDRMPEVARGVASWTAAETAHVASCAECRQEWALVRAAVNVGAQVEAEFDATGSAEAVRRRLRRSASVRWPGRSYLAGLAAAAALALVVGRPTPVPVVVSPVAEVRFLLELDSLTVEELTVVAEGLDVPLSETEMIEGQPLFELDTTQLERVLRSLEG